MKKITICLLACIFSLTFIQAQELSPDKFINKIKKGNDIYAFTIPGWLIKKGGKIALNDEEINYDEREIIRELTSHIKKLRFVVSDGRPEDYESNFNALKNYISNHNYEELISVRDKGNYVNLWALFDDKTIKRMVLSVNAPSEGTAFFNIKSDIDMEKLSKMKFFKEWSSL